MCTARGDSSRWPHGFSDGSDEAGAQEAGGSNLINFAKFTHTRVWRSGFGLTIADGMRIENGTS